ncbi:FAD binding domain protein [Microdochium trichocladiopsis]|uniref:FAD binding domain protein n=1 Tax=Microdochium trichocladiopsis TaxID=1682393 RepID=A0A9P8YAN3_9PEZI|nr:FAD binding domain protein [Microdochium trichocladiopsis]KAH7033741.1 FAD binding domain protein [Microdochium trichocladiopsis]
MAAHKPFKVIIAGGGVAGLTLAQMFEKFDIDYVLLEAYQDITPPVGASIGLMPNGLLVLDQIGCYEAVRKVAESANNGEAYTRDPNGRPLSVQRSLFQHLGKRHGYEILFFDRQWLLKVLYDQLRHKDRVRINQRVQKITTGPTGVEVTTTNGETFSGSIVIGADGIHSTVRQEMRRLADDRSPGYFPQGEEDNVPSYYQCSFGIAQDVKNWIQGEQTTTCGHGKSFLVASGPEGRCYWFLLIKLPNVMRGKNIPKFTKQDEEKMVQESRGLKIKENLTFGEVYDKRISSTLTALHEVVFEKWFYERIMLIGDSAHKPNPIGGMGGNGAIESAAELLNHLLDVRDRRVGGLDGIGTAEVQEIFQQLQQTRFNRATEIVEAAHKQQALLAYENPFISQAILHVGARLLSGGDNTLALMGSQIVGGSRLKHAPVPSRPRVIPFEHELPAAQFSAQHHTIIRIVYCLILGALLLFATRAFGQSVPWVDLLTVGKTLPADAKAQAALVTVQLIAPLLVWVVEAYRAGNQNSLVSLPTLFAAATSFLGISRVVLLYAIAMTTSPLLNPAHRAIQPAAVKSILPALLLGYIIPSIVMVSQLGDGVAVPTTLWHFAPAMFSLGTAIIWKTTALLRNHREVASKVSDGNDDQNLDRYRDLELPILNATYIAAFLALSSTHTWALVNASFSSSGPAVFGINVLVNQFPIFDLTRALPAILLFELYTVYEMRRLGQITTITAIRAACLVLLAQILVGPGASWIGLWFWRENTIAGLSTLNEKN